jgi:type IV pilus assembly protein PilM
MFFPIYRHDLPWDGVDDSRARSAARHRHSEATDERTSIWKREISLGRRKPKQEGELVTELEATEETPADADAVSAEVEPESERTSIWKRELKLGRRKTTEQIAEPEPEESAEAVEPETEHEPWSSSDREAIETPAPFLTAHLYVTDAEGPSEESAVEPETEPEPWLSSFDREPVETPTPVPALETYDAAGHFEESAAPETEWPEPEAESTSIWKRELSFGRRKTSDPEVTAEGAEPEESADVADSRPDDAEGTSIWKRELSFGRRSRASQDWEFDLAGEGEADAPETDTWPATAAFEAGEAEPVESEPVEIERAEVQPAEELLPLPAAAFEPEIEIETRPAPAQSVVAEAEAPSSDKRERKKRPSARAERRAAKGKKGGTKLVGLKIGASQIAAAYVHSNGSHEVLKLARTPLDRGVVVAGEIRDPDALAVALRNFFNQNKLPKRDVRLGIASNRVGVRVLDVTGVDDPALFGNAVHFRAQEVLPIPLSEAVLDYRVLRDRTDDEGNVTHEVLVVFAYRELVDRYASVCRLAGLRLVGIDLDGFGLLRALVDPAAPDPRLGGAAVVAVALGHDRSIMSVSDGSVCEFTRVIEWGGSSLDTAVARILALTPSEAEPIKRELTLDRNAPVPEGLSPEQAGRARTAMLQEAHAFAREFVSSLQFYQAQPRSLDIGEIVVTGGTAHMPGLVEQLQELIGVTVRIGDPLSRVKVGKHVSTDESIGSLALAIGLGIED